MPLGETLKNWLFGPKALIALSAAIGLLGWGFSGLIGGLIFGLVASLLLGGIIRAFQGGSIPRRVKRDLVANLLEEQPEVVRAAYPGMNGAQMLERLEGDLENIVSRAVKKAVAEGRRHEELWAAENILGAAHLQIVEEMNPRKSELLGALRRQIMRDWYGMGA